MVLVVSISTLPACEGGDGPSEPGVPEPGVAEPSAEPAAEPGVVEPAVQPDVGEPEAVVPDDCEGQVLRNDGALTLETESFEVQGALTVNGETNSDVTAATLTFTDRDTGAVAVANILSDSRYSTRLPAGTYDVTYTPLAQICFAQPDRVPCHPATVFERLTLSSAGVLDVDVEKVEVQLSLTVDGSAVGAGNLGFIVLTNDDGASAFPVRSSPWPVAVPAGRYDVAYAPAGDCSVDNGMPCTGAVLQEDVNLSADGVLQLNLPTTTVSGTATVNGAPLSSGFRGTLTFSPEGAASGTLSLDGTSTYTVRVAQGRYSVRWDGQGASCEGAADVVVPCGGQIVAGDLTLQAEGQLDVDVNAARVTGSVGLDGSPFPVESSGEGALTFRSTSDGNVFTTLVDGDGYNVLVVADTYDVSLTDSNCDDGSFCGGAFAGRDVALTTDGAFNVDVSTIDVSGGLTLNGGALPAGVTAEHTGWAVFVSADGFSARLPYDATSYQGRIPAARYDVSWQRSSLDDTGLPLADTPAHSDVNLAASGSLDIDLETFTLTYNTLHNGAAIDVGTLTFAGADDGMGALQTEFNSDTLVLPDGAWRVLRTPEAGCDGASTATCAAEILFGCD